MEQLVRFIIYFLTLLSIIILSAYVFAMGASAQTIDSQLRPDFSRVLTARQQIFDGDGRKGAYRPARSERHLRTRSSETSSSSTVLARVIVNPGLNITATTLIAPGTALSRILHTSQFTLNSSAGTDEQFVDRNSDLTADERTTFDLAGGSFDIAVGPWGARYEVYSAKRNQTLVGVLVVALDTNGDYLVDTSSTYDLQRDFSLPSAASVVSGSAR